MRISRRGFLRTGLTTGAMLAPAPILDMKAWAAESSQAPVEVRPSIRDGCASHCGIFVHVKNGRLWKVTGQPQHPTSKGKLCAKAHGAAFRTYDRDRITQPLKRWGNKFTPISWDQALDEIAAKLKGILEEYGPGAVFMAHHPMALSKFYLPRFASALGVSTVMAHSAACNTTVIKAWATMLGGTPGADDGNSKFVLYISRNPAEGIKTSYTNALAKSIANGAKVVVVDPRQSVTAAIANEWVPIRPGTDLALLLAMAHVIITENLYDANFVRDHTTGFAEFAAAVQEYTPEWAEDITTVPAATITRLAREMAAAKPHCVIDSGWKGAPGTSYVNSLDMVRAIAAVNLLMGNLGQPGGLKFSSGPKLGSLDPEKHPSPPKPTVPRADGAGIPGEFPLAPSQGLPHVLMQKAREGKVKAGFIRHFNPVRNFPDPRHMRAGLEALDLLVVVDVYLSETAMLADYVLPEPSYLEREEIVEGLSGARPAVAMQSAALAKLHPETRGFEEIVQALAERLGAGQYFNFTLEELNAAMLKPLGITVDQLREKGTIVLDAPTGGGGVPKLKTKSGKAEFASPDFAKFGFNAVPRWLPPRVAPDPGNPRSFRLIHGKEAYHSHTTTTNLPYLLQISKDYDTDRLWINAKRAAALGIRDGDLVTICNGQATAQIRAKVTERLHPDAVYLPMGYGIFSPYLREAYGYGVSMNDFVPYQTDPLIGHTMMMEVLVEVEKA